MTVDDEGAVEKLIEVGLVTREQLLEAQVEAERTGQPLGKVLVGLGHVSAAQLENAREAAQQRSRFCPRCGTAVPVPRRTPKGDCCPGCLGPVEWREDRHAGRGDTVTLDVAQLTQDELPPEVLVARSDRARHFGKYILMEQVGRGGVGVVHKAWDTLMGEFVALKFLREPAAVPDSVEEARRTMDTRVRLLIKEARAAMRMRHENVVSIRDVGRVGPRYFIAMEYIDGETLSEHIRAAAERGRISPLYDNPALYVRIMRDCALAVHYGHSLPEPIIHCDLKPSNILIDAGGTGRVMDFGIARVLGRSDESKSIQGTPAYMAPEQVVAGSPVDARTDVYGLGAILYELLCGRPVFTGDTSEVLRSLLDDTPQSPSEVVQQAKEAPEPRRRDDTRRITKMSVLEGTCMRCLRKDPGKRLPTALAVAEQLEVVLEALEGGDETGQREFVPPRLSEAQRDAECHGVDRDMTGLRLEEAMERVDGIRARRGDALREWAHDRHRHGEMLAQLRDRLVERLNATRPRLERLKVQGTALVQVEIVKATAQKMIVFHGQQALDVAWSALPPAQFVALVETAGLQSPEDRLALLVYAHYAKLVDIAVRLARSLSGTAHEPAVRALMEQTQGG